MPAEEAQEQLSQRFEKLQDENLKAIQDEVNKLSRIEQTQMVIEKSLLIILQRYWRRANVETHKYLLSRLARTRLNNLYNVVFDGDPREILTYSVLFF